MRTRTAQQIQIAMRKRTIQPEKRVRTRSATQPALFQDDPDLIDDEVVLKINDKKTALDIMMDLQYTKIPNIYNRNPSIGSFFYYKKNNAIYKRTEVTRSGMWIGQSVSGLSNFKTCKADPDDCVRLPNKDPLVDVYDFITNFKSFQDDKTTYWCLNICLFKIENTLKTIYLK